MRVKKSVPKVSSVQKRALLQSLQGSAEQADAGQSRKQTKYRVVADTSVLASAIFYGGKSETVLKHILAQQVLVTSDYIIDELIKFAKNTSPKTPRKFIKALRDQLEPYAKEYDTSETVLIRDINDTDIVQLAIAHNAMIVASDKDLLSFKNPKVTIISPAEYGELFMDDVAK